MPNRKKKLARLVVVGVPTVFFGYSLWLTGNAGPIPRDSLEWILFAACAVVAYAFVRVVLGILYWLVDRINPTA